MGVPPACLCTDIVDWAGHITEPRSCSFCHTFFQGVFARAALAKPRLRPFVIEGRRKKLKSDSRDQAQDQDVKGFGGQNGRVSHPAAVRAGRHG